MSDLGLSYRTAFEGGYDVGEVKRIEIREGFGKHQIALLDFNIPAGNYTNLPPERTPMALRWGTSPVEQRTFYGYVNHHEYVDTNQASGMLLRFYCIGTSLPMNGPNPTSWKDVTASYIARSVAERHGLRAVVTNSKEIMPYWAPGQDSDFTMMNRLAEESGYRFWVDGATLFFTDPEVLLTSPKRGLTSTYRQDRSLDDRLLQVHAITGSLAPVASAPSIQQVFGIDFNGNLIRSSSTQALTDRGLPSPGGSTVLDRNVSSLGKAMRLNEQAAVGGTWSSIQAVTLGDAKALVGSLINLDGNALNQSYHGVWMAQELIHVIFPNTAGAMVYHTQIELIRNQKSQTLFSTTSTIKDALSEVSAVLRGGKTWESSILESVYV